MKRTIPPRSGVAFALARGQRLRITDLEGEQVGDLVCFNRDDPREHLSSGRTLDYGNKLLFTTGDELYSNRSQVMLRITQDSVGRHDFLLAPCSREMFRRTYGDPDPPPGCHGNLAAALAEYGVGPDAVPTAFNVFMNVQVEMPAGRLAVQPPLSRAGDTFTVEAVMDLIVGLTACSAGQSNNFRYKPIQFEILADQDSPVLDSPSGEG